MKKNYLLCVCILIFSFSLESCYDVIFNTASPRILYIEVLDSETLEFLENVSFSAYLYEQELTDLVVSNDDECYTLFSTFFGDSITYGKYSLTDAYANTKIEINKIGYGIITVNASDSDKYYTTVKLEKD